MGNWDYGVSAKREDSNAVITEINVHAFNPDNTVNPGTEWTKSQGVSAIESGSRMCTMLKDSSGKWNIQALIRVVKGPHGKYLRTDANKTEKDNLENLPSF